MPGSRGQVSLQCTYVIALVLVVQAADCFRWLDQSYAFNIVVMLLIGIKSSLSCRCVHLAANKDINVEFLPLCM